MILEKLEREVGITSDLACDILGESNILTLNEDFHKACKLGLRAIRELQYKEKDATAKSD